MFKNVIKFIFKWLFHKIKVNSNGRISLARYYKSLKCKCYVLLIFCPKLTYFRANQVYVGQFGQFKAHHDFFVFLWYTPTGVQALPVKALVL
jgi:hypothetical protein